MFYDNLKSACALRGTTVTASLKKLGMSTGNGKHWKNGVTPSIDVIIQFAELLDVPVDYLAIGKTLTTSMLSADELELINFYRNLSQINKGRVIQKAEDLLEAENSSAENSSKEDVS